MIHGCDNSWTATDLLHSGIHINAQWTNSSQCRAQIGGGGDRVGADSHQWMELLVVTSCLCCDVCTQWKI